MSESSLTLLSTATSNGNDTLVRRSGTYRWRVWGTFGGATVSLQEKLPSGSYVAFEGGYAALTAEGGANIMVPGGTIIRASVSGGSPAALNSTADLIDAHA